MSYATSTNNPADEVPVYRYITVENVNNRVEFLGLDASSEHDEAYIESVTVRGCDRGTIDHGRDFEIWDSYAEDWSMTDTENIRFLYSDSESSTDIKAKDGAEHVESVGS